MKRNQDHRRESSPLPWRTSISDKPDRRHRVKCDVIQSLLLDYLNRELDAVRSDMVWKHLMKCAECEKEAKEMETTLELLRKAARAPANAPAHLSDKHRASIVRALTHPVLHWMEQYHVVASLLVALVVILAIVAYLRWVGGRQHRVEEPSGGTPVSLIFPPPPEPTATNEASATNAVPESGP